jgi:hypothetical protein
VAFFSHGGHDHDGRNSSLINLDAYLAPRLEQLERNIGQVRDIVNDGDPTNPENNVPNDGRPPGAPQNVVVTAGYNALYVEWDMSDDIDMVYGWGTFRVELSEDSVF